MLVGALRANAAKPSRQCVDTCKAQGLSGKAYRACVANCSNGACSVDADCTTFSDFCDGCNCRALGVYQPDPVCTGVKVSCEMDPCLYHVKYCDGRTCKLRDLPQ